MYDKVSRPDNYAKLFIYVVADRAANIFHFLRVYELCQFKY